MTPSPPEFAFSLHPSPINLQRNDDAKWLAAASKDRSLMWQGKPQLYGTQFKKVDGRWVLWDVGPTITDEERAKWNVPPLAEQKKKVEKLNAPRQ